MEHRVKQRSQEWIKLRQTVMLTASQFADAVGVGKGRPFHFFQSMVQREENPVTVNDLSKTEKEMIQHGEQMESVIKEAYELLTGRRVLESGFWTPQAGHSMEGLIGASPDGLVVSEKDAKRTLGLVEFKAPLHKLYDKIPDTRHGIPRRYMVQIQGQMAVCGAPWCDFMAVCSKMEDIMLKRVYFQPRYWEHIASRLKQFCFALQEAEIMGELKRDVYSGAMTQRIKSLPMQEKPFPAEDLITVENLLTRSPLQLYRGPSQTLLSYQILVGDAYVLPSTLSRYQQDLLAKVDREIHCKDTHLSRDKAQIEEEEVGQVLQRLFSEDTTMSSETLFREGSDVVSSETVFREGSDVVSSETVFREESAMRGKENVSIPADRGTVSAMSSKDRQIKNSAGAPRSGNTHQGTPVTFKDGASAPQPSSGRQSAPTSTPTTQSHFPRTEMSQFRRLSRINTNPRQTGNIRPATANSQPRAAVASQTQHEVRPGHTPRMPGAPRAPRALLNTPGVQRHGPRAASVRNTAPRLAPKSPALSRAPGNSPRARFAGPRTASLRNSGSSSSSTQSQVGVGATAHSSRGNSTSLSTSTVSVSSTAGSPVVRTASSPQILKKPLMSARQEWEKSATKKTPPARQDENKATSSAIVTQAKLTAESKTSAGTGNVSLPSAQSQEKEGGKTSSQNEGMKWETRILSSGSPFVPPGLTLLSSSSSSQTQPTSVNVTTGGNSKPTTQQRSSQPEPATFGGAKEDHHLKRSSTSAPEAEPSKKPLLQHGDEKDWHRSTDRFPIHRPWQSLEGGRGEQGGGLERQTAFARDPVEGGHDRLLDLGAHPRLLPPEERGGARIPSVLDRGRDDAHSRAFDYDLQDRVLSDDFHHPGWKRGQHGSRANPMSSSAQFESMRHLPLDLSERHHHQDRDLFPGSRALMLGRDGSLGLDRGTADSGGWRGQFSRQSPHQLRPQWLSLGARPEGLSLRNPLHGNWPRGQGHRLEGQHGLDLQPPLRDRRFPDLEGRDPRLADPSLDFRGDLIRGPFPRNFPRRPFDF